MESENKKSVDSWRLSHECLLFLNKLSKSNYKSFKMTNSHWLFWDELLIYHKRIYVLKEYNIKDKGNLIFSKENYDL